MGGTASSVQEEPEPGDLIEITRLGYNHWVIYVGGGNVIHLTVPDGPSGVCCSSPPSTHVKKGLVKKQPLSTVAAGGTYCISKKYEQRYNRRPREEILRDAEAMVGQWVDYKLFGNNCEHFATGLCYGVRKSKQAEDGLVAGTVIGLGVTIVGLAGLAMAFLDTSQTGSESKMKIAAIDLPAGK